MLENVDSEFSVDIKHYAENILHETTENRQKGLEELMKWATANSNLHIRTDEKYIIPFLRGCKFDVEKTKEKLTHFYTMRRDVPEWFTNRNPHLSEIQDLTKMGTFIVLKETFENKLVMIVRPTMPDPSTYDLDTIIKTGTMILDVAVMEEELAQIYGVYAIIDLKNTGFRHVRQYTPTRIKNIVNAWQNYHCRPKKLLFINAPTFIHVVLNIFKSFMTQKLKERIQVSYEGNSALVNSIDTSILPQDYGGNRETMSELGLHWIEKLNSYKEWFFEDEKYKAD
ncbi:retinol-binding protein pinta-like [Coccinella septempunctata]|uniref:retinol-binding protein pinta-like n=1 Tax=Coccinella septempunctata TaxID=41139 RepID=UPI001D064CE7|nr:retinol-binding protein pinta-like [Coccinella septempunctata]